MFTKRIILILGIATGLSFPAGAQGTNGHSSEIELLDQHVHILSPALVSFRKAMDIPFSRPDYYYSDVDSIFKFSGAKKVNLVSMAYIFSSGEYGGVSEDVYAKIANENDNLAKAKSKFRTEVKAFYGIDPLHEQALPEVIRCHTALNLDGIKLHFNASQVYLTVPEHLAKVKVIFSYASAQKIPILMHFDNSHPKFGRRDVLLLLDSVLAGLQYVDLRIAHFGTSGGFSEKTKNVLDSFIEVFSDTAKLNNHKILFDIFAVAFDKDSEGVSKLTDEQFDELAGYCRKLGLHRIILGSDYPLYTALDYITVLKNKLNFTPEELGLILSNK